jgi:alpha-ketoglutarate-dependent taurine dioxygenase
MTTTVTTPQVQRLGRFLGAQVHGIDLRDDLTPATVAEIDALLLEHKVLFFPGQSLDSDTQIRFARNFGELTSAHPVVPAVDDAHPEIWQIEAIEGVRNDLWHTDVTFVQRPPLGSVLRAITVPDVGGDTNWADLEAAYASLSPAVQTLVDGLTARHDGSREFGAILAGRTGTGNIWDGEVFSSLEPVEHPVVRVHPVTGRRSIFVNPGFTTSIVGLSDAESRAVLDLLFAHITKPEHIVRHRWAAGDVAFWDNRNTAHYANFDYGDFHRVMQRVTLAGDDPRGPSDPPAAAAAGRAA